MQSNNIENCVTSDFVLVFQKEKRNKRNYNNKGKKEAVLICGHLQMKGELHQVLYIKKVFPLVSPSPEKHSIINKEGEITVLHLMFQTNYQKICLHNSNRNT